MRSIVLGVVGLGLAVTPVAQQKDPTERGTPARQADPTPQAGTSGTRALPTKEPGRDAPESVDESTEASSPLDQGVARRRLDPATAGPARRIWAPITRERQDVGFRRRLRLTHAPKNARLVLSCDNEFAAYVNGALVGQSRHWEDLLVIELDNLNPGDNTIAILGRNTGSCAALAAWLIWTDAKGDTFEIVTDATWRISESPPRGWEQPKFDDSKWQAPDVTDATPFGQNVHGMAPASIEWRGPRYRTAERIRRALDAYRSATDVDAAQRALTELESAVMAARRDLWTREREKREAPAAAPNPPRKATPEARPNGSSKSGPGTGRPPRRR